MIDLLVGKFFCQAYKMSYGLADCTLASVAREAAHCFILSLVVSFNSSLQYVVRNVLLLITSASDLPLRIN